MNTKPALTLVTDPELIAKLEADPNSLELPISTKYNGAWWAYADDMKRYRQNSHRNPLEVVS